MVVNSINFLLFFTVVFIVYYLPISRRHLYIQNLWLLLTSYFFYGVTDWRMALILFFATIAFYMLGLWLKKEMSERHAKKASFVTSLGVCLGIGLLLYFKYLNFFGDSFAHLLSMVGLKTSWSTISILVPIGVSFFTFKLISYVIEIHREHIDPCKDFVEFGTYIAFFPTILSGPIDRPNSFLPQLRKHHFFDYNTATDGCRQILWGMFTKMCIADNLSGFIDSAWQNMTTQTSSSLVMAVLLYPIQIYADFDGYSNMAIGVSKILGIKVTRNFNHPLLARNIAEYWRNWHISLTSWLTDYVFTPLNIAFRNFRESGLILAIIVNFIIIGFWHGASWTFGLFGLFHGILYIPLVISGNFGKRKKIRANHYGLPPVKDLMKIATTYSLVACGLIIFRATDLTEVGEFISHICTNVSYPIAYPSKRLVLLILFALTLEWIQREKEHAFVFPKNKYFDFYIIRLAIYVCTILVIFFYHGIKTNFIYFQF